MYKNLKDNVPNEKHQIDPKTIGGSLKIINPNLTHNRHNHIISGKCNRRAQEYVLYPQKYSNTLLIKTNSRAAKDIKYQNTDRRKNCQAILKNHKNSHMKSNTHTYVMKRNKQKSLGKIEVCCFMKTTSKNPTEMFA